MRIKLAFPAHLSEGRGTKILHQKPDVPALKIRLRVAFVSELWLFNCRLCSKLWLGASFAHIYLRNEQGRGLGGERERSTDTHTTQWLLESSYYSPEHPHTKFVSTAHTRSAAAASQIPIIYSAARG
jgi:hypothetical protein